MLQCVKTTPTTNLEVAQNDETKPIGKGNDESEDVVTELPPSKPRIVNNGRRRSSLMRGIGSTLGNASIKTLLEEPLFDQVGRQSAGQSFGELALVKERPRAARIVCETDCQFACMCKKDYEEILK